MLLRHASSLQLVGSSNLVYRVNYRETYRRGITDAKTTAEIGPHEECHYKGMSSSTGDIKPPTTLNLFFSVCIRYPRVPKLCVIFSS